MTRLAPALEHERAMWRREVESAKASHDESLREIESRRVSVIIDYEGEPPELAGAGAEPGFDINGMVLTTVAFADLDRLAALEGITWVAIHPTMQQTLDGTVKEMKVPWKSGAGGFAGRGANVIVAVIDSGIDIFHESFVKADGTSRILELWDQNEGLVGGVLGPGPWGRLYSQQDINRALAANPRMPFQSKDTTGHGTHVAGIAAGSGRQDDRCSPPGRYAGVAPDADLVIVKRNSTEDLAGLAIISGVPRLGAATVGGRWRSIAVSVISWVHTTAPMTSTACLIESSSLRRVHRMASRSSPAQETPTLTSMRAARSHRMTTRVYPFSCHPTRTSQTIWRSGTTDLRSSTSS
jgi:subtilisin family serine protease